MPASSWLMDLFHITPGQDGTSSDKAEAFMGLGRIASKRGQIGQALEYYQQAADLAPVNTQLYLFHSTTG